MSQEVEVIVLGNEPAALWLLSQKPPIFSSVLWFSTPDSCVRTIPHRAATAFKINSNTLVKSEFIFPDRRAYWDDAELERRFPKLASYKDASPEEDVINQIEAKIEKFPSFLLLSQALWRLCNLSVWPRQGVLGLNALWSTQLVTWNVESELPSTVSKIDLDLSDLEEVTRDSQGRWYVHLRGKSPVLANNLLLALDLDGIERVATRFASVRDLFSAAPLSKGIAQRSYSFEVKVGRNAIPWPTAPLFLLHETEYFADPIREVWPFHLERDEKDCTLIGEILAPLTISFEALCEQFKRVLAELHQRFPFFSTELRQIIPALGMETCYSDHERQVAENQQFLFSKPICAVSSLSIRTRVTNAFVLGPFTHCHLPYPWGALSAAHSFLQSWPRKKVKKLEASPSL